MNDADLEKLIVKPGLLKPAFDRNITAYQVTLESSAKQITITPVTRDTDASWIIVGCGTVRQIPLKDGDKKDIVIEVTAEDGTTKRYTINVIVLSADDASLSGIKLSTGSLTPAFKHDIFDYSVNLPWNLETVTILPEAKDKNIGGANDCLEVALNYGETMKVVETLSPNKACSNQYSIRFTKERIWRLINPVDDKEKVYCAICLGEVHCAVSIKQTIPSDLAKVICCKKCMDMITRTRKMDPFTEVPLAPDSVLDESDFDVHFSNIKVFCCYKHAGCEIEIELSKLGSHMNSCEFKPILAPRYEGVILQNQIENVEKISVGVCSLCGKSVGRDEACTHIQLYCPAKVANTKFEHVVKLRDWEKKFQQNIEAISPEHGTEFTEKDDVAQLEIAAARYAGMIKMKPRDPLNHFRLATVLEEMFYAQDIWGMKKKGSEHEDDDNTFENLMDIASDSSKEEEILAICKSKGLKKNAELSHILKALDQEYHELLNENQSAKADYVQKLYAWKSKQSAMKAKTSLIQSDEEFLERALLKFLDASACDPNNSAYHMHVGRLLLMQGKYEDGVKRLEAAFGLKPTSIEAKFYLGLAYAKFYMRQYRQGFATLKYLQDGIDYIMFKLCEDAPSQSQLPHCSSKVFARHSNTLMMEGMLELANLLSEKGSPAEKDTDRIMGMYQQTSKICIQMLSNMKHKNKTYKQLQWIVLRAQFSLGLIKSQVASSGREREIIGKYWERLASLSRAFELPQDDKILQMQRNICEEAVMLCPASSRALFHLGDTQLALFDSITEGSNENDTIDNRINYLDDAEKSYRASIQFEGKPVNGTEHSWLIKESAWWKKRHEKSWHLGNKTMKAQPKATTTPQSKPNQTTKSVSKASTPVNKGPTKASKPAQVKVSAPTTSRVTAEAKKGRAIASTSKSQNVGKNMNAISDKSSGQKLARSTKSPHSSGCTTSKTTADRKGSTPNAARNVQRKQCEKENGKELENEDTKVNGKEDSKEKEIVLNSLGYQARLGLARTLSRSPNDYHWAELKELYQEVIKMAPELHDAYIELSEMVAQTEPKQAIEIYSKYPFKKEGTFDDAYLYGEIIRLIMKTEDYDNLNLRSSMEGYGKIMGFSALEKTVSVLESKFKFDVLMQVYAAVNDKVINDEDLQTFFKFKCWI